MREVVDRETIERVIDDLETKALHAGIASRKKDAFGYRKRKQGEANGMHYAITELKKALQDG